MRRLPDRRRTFTLQRGSATLPHPAACRAQTSAHRRGKRQCSPRTGSEPVCANALN
ncbi:hypothetical protein ISF6_5127 [Piscinibacter sakaiensis]|uniref:Uncharacterized protein n=1 Tax=Piscinibacter sakaiensis TaxID=1547922 RepID=A0A0K8P7Q3_PISS1|nr:hypothetical protein ISF6_5127 [Piscinibacter sakaiensis]